jgi:hypothetical protein
MDPRMTAAVTQLVGLISDRCRRYFRRKPNYEDIAYVLRQISDDQSGNYENPALVPLTKWLRHWFKAPLGTLACEAKAYIHCVVQETIFAEPHTLATFLV